MRAIKATRLGRALRPIFFMLRCDRALLCVIALLLAACADPEQVTHASSAVVVSPNDERAYRLVQLETYPFTKIEATYQLKPDGSLGKQLKRDLVALKSNPYYFGSDIYAPKTLEQGGPFTIGRVIHSNRHPTLSAWIGGVAVFDRALSGDEMKKLATIGNCTAPAK